MGCAASVRGDLKKIDGITDIKTDITAKVCSFKVEDSEAAMAQVAKFAESNTHLADYEKQ